MKIIKLKMILIFKKLYEIKIIKSFLFYKKTDLLYKNIYFKIKIFKNFFFKKYKLILKKFILYNCGLRFIFK